MDSIYVILLKFSPRNKRLKHVLTPFSITMMKFTKKREVVIISVFFLVMGIANLIISSLSGFDMHHMNVLAFLCFTASFGLLSLKKWGLHLGFILLILEGWLLLIMIYVSANLGFLFTVYTLIFILWLAFLVLAGIYLSSQRALFLAGK